MGRTLMWLRRALAVLAALALFLAAVVAVNQEEISLRFLAWRTPSLSAFWWLLSALALGLALGLSAAAGLAAKQSIRGRRLRKELLAANEELQKLRENAHRRTPEAHET